MRHMRLQSHACHLLSQVTYLLRVHSVRSWCWSRHWLQSQMLAKEIPTISKKGESPSWVENIWDPPLSDHKLVQTISTGLCLTFLHSMCLFDSDHIRGSAPRPVARRHHQLVHEVDDRPGGLVKVKLGKHVTLEMCHVLNKFLDFMILMCMNVIT